MSSGRISLAVFTALLDARHALVPSCFAVRFTAVPSVTDILWIVIPLEVALRAVGEQRLLSDLSAIRGVEVVVVC